MFGKPRLHSVLSGFCDKLSSEPHGASLRAFFINSDFVTHATRLAPGALVYFLKLTL